MSEAEWKTRKERIDKRLRSLPRPWTIIPFGDGLDTGKLTMHAVEECPTANGPADYALFVDGTLMFIPDER
jgi:type I restriction enzyme R subunit